MGQRRHIGGAGLVLALLLSGCSPTSAELLTAGQWSAAARVAVKDPALCAPAQACSAAVQVMASEGAGRAQAKAGAVACVLPRPVRPAVPIISLDGFIALADAAARAAAAALAERETVRQMVLQQATADLMAERDRCGQ